MTSKSRVPGVSEARAQIVEQCLSRRPWLSVSDLALVLGTSHPAALIVLNRLHAAGYLIRRIGISNSSLFRCQLYALPGAAPQNHPAACVPEAPARESPRRREDGVLVCPPAYAHGYEPGCRRPALTLRRVGVA
jgi:hypothetical protein